MKNADVCPWCGASRIIEPFRSTTTEWECGSSIGCAHQTQGHRCKVHVQAIAEHELKRKLKGQTMPVKAEHAQFFEVEDLLDLVQADGSIHDLDQYDENNMQTTLGAVLCGLMKRLEKAEAEVNRLRVYASYANFD